MNDGAVALCENLNPTTEFEKTVNKYFPETVDWIFHLATNEDYLITGSGPANVNLPELPVSELEDRGMIEVWLKTTPLQAMLLKTFLVDWEVANDALRELLPEEDVAKIGEDVQLKRCGDWSVILVGKLQDS